jgi:hypothetical protein
MLQKHAAECRQQAEECRREGLAARSEDDRTAWLQIADEWLRLAERAEAEVATVEAEPGDNATPIYSRAVRR